MARTKKRSSKYTKGMSCNTWVSKRRRAVRHTGGLEKLRTTIMFGVKREAGDHELALKLQWLSETCYKLQRCGGYLPKYLEEGIPLAPVEDGPDRIISVSPRDRQIILSEKTNLHGFELIARPKGLFFPAVSDIRAWIEREYLRPGWLLNISDADLYHMFHIGATGISPRVTSNTQVEMENEPTVFSTAFLQVALAASDNPEIGTFSYNAHNNPSLYYGTDLTQSMVKVLDRPCPHCANSKARGKVFCSGEDWVCGRRTMNSTCGYCAECRRRGFSHCHSCGRGIGAKGCGQGNAPRRREVQATDDLPGVNSTLFITNRSKRPGYAPAGQHWNYCEDIFRLVEEDHLGGKLAIVCFAQTKIMFRTKNDFDNPEWKANSAWLSRERNYDVKSERDTHAANGGPKERGFNDETRNLFEDDAVKVKK